MTEILPLALVFLSAVLLDLILGDPVYPYHPVRIMGKVVASLEHALRRMRLSGRGGGIILVLAALGLTWGAVQAARSAAGRILPQALAVIDVFLVYSCLAFRDLLRHAGRVAAALEDSDLEGARKEVAHMVGRDVDRLDSSGVARAAVESVAEGFVDGFLGAAFWFVGGAALAALAGATPRSGAVLGICLFRAINTMDSMIGHRDARYIEFGRAAARLDDAAVFVPARLSIPIMGLGAVLAGADAAACLKIGARDRLKHDSPNSAHAESCAAGALRLRLGGPSRYSGEWLDRPWLGDGTTNPTARHIRRSMTLVMWSGIVASALFAAALACLF